MAAVKRIAWATVLAKTDRGQPRPTLTNAVTVLNTDPRWDNAHLWYDEFLDRIFLANSAVREWRDDDDTRLAVYMQQDVIGMTTVPDTIVRRAAEMVARQRVRHVVRDYLAELEWDGIARIDEAFVDYWNATPSPAQPHEYLRAVSHNFFIGLVARIMRPGCQLDEMVVFESLEQGLGKTSALRVLGGAWYAVAHERVTEKDFFQDIQGKWIIEIAELSSFTSGTRNRIKTVISTPTDRFRGSYDRRSSDHGRQCVFVGTTNEDDWADDDTGLRRFWPVRVGVIELEAIGEIRNQLFAEAMVRFLDGESWWKVPESAKLVQAERQNYDEWAGIVMPWIDLQLAQGAAFIAVREVLVGPLKVSIDAIDKKCQMRVSKILKLAGWTRDTLRVGSSVQKVWFPPQGGNTNDGGNAF